MAPPTVFGDIPNHPKSLLTPMFAGAISTLHLISAIDRDPQGMLNYILGLEKQNSDLKALIRSSSKEIYLATFYALSSANTALGKTITHLDNSLKAKGDGENHLLMRQWITDVGRVVYAAEGELKDLLTRLNQFVASAYVDDVSAKTVETGKKRKERHDAGYQNDYDVMEWKTDEAGKKRARKSNSTSGLRTNSDNLGMSSFDENIESGPTKKSPENIPRGFGAFGEATTSPKTQRLLSLYGIDNGDSEEPAAKTGPPYEKDWIAQPKNKKAKRAAVEAAEVVIQKEQVKRRMSKSVEDSNGTSMLTKENLDKLSIATKANVKKLSKAAKDMRILKHISKAGKRAVDSLKLSQLETVWICRMECYYDKITWPDKQEWFACIIEKYRMAQLSLSVHMKENNMQELEKDIKAKLVSKSWLNSGQAEDNML